MSTSPRSDLVAGVFHAHCILDGFSRACVLAACIETRLFDALNQPMTETEILDLTGWHTLSGHAVLQFLQRAGYIVPHTSSDGPLYSLSRLGTQVQLASGWIELIAGGYGITLHNLARLLRSGPDGSARDFARLAHGSTAMTRAGALPVILSHLSKQNPGLIVDIGCGDQNLLVAYSQQHPEARVLGVEPNAPMPSSANIHKNISFQKGDLLNADVPSDADVIILSFVLHELYGTHGPEGVVDALARLRRIAPNSMCVVVEVDADWRKLSWCTPCELGYYNVYALLQSITGQNLRPLTEWRDLICTAGWHIESILQIEKDIDSTGLEVILELH